MFFGSSNSVDLFLYFILMKDIILAWISASGKWTQSHKLLKYFGDKLKYFETWWILRSLQSSDNAIWNYLKNITANWLLVKDEIISWLFWIFLETLSQWDVVLADWCMRRLWQTKSIMKQFEIRKRDFIVIELIIPEEEVYKRLENRLICKKCGLSFNVLSDGEINKCLECSGELYRRNDDQDINAIKNRIDVYKNDIIPALEMLDTKWFLVKIDWIQKIDEVFQEILNIVKN